MQSRKELNVDVHTRAIRAAERTNGGGKLHQVLDTPQPVQMQWWRKFFHWEKLIVAGKVIEKGWVVPQPLGIALLLVILGGVGGLYWRIIDKQVEQEKTFNSAMSEQRELLIRLDQRLIDKNAHDAEKFEHLEKRFQNTDAVQIALGRDLAKLAARGK